MERYPKDVIASIEDFKDCGWKEVVESSDSEEYSAFWTSLATAAKRAIEEEKNAIGKVLWLLADVCSMMLEPSNHNEPFQPFAVMRSGSRSAILQDLQEEDIQLFSQIADQIDNARIRARIADTVWILLKPKEPKYALMAIDAYSELPIDLDTWLRDGRECYERAIGLCRMLKTSAGERLMLIEEAFVKSLEAATIEDGYLAFWIADLLLKYKLAKLHLTAIANKLKELGEEFDSVGDLHRSRDYLNLSSLHYRKLENEAAYVALVVQVAESLVKEATAKQSTGPQGQFAAAHFLEDAILKYRTIPKTLRSGHKVEERIVELRAELRDAGERASKQMGVIESDAIDIGPFVESARNRVSGKESYEAFVSFTTIYSGAVVSDIRSLVLKQMERSPMRMLFNATHLSSDGRVIARRSGVGFWGGFK